MRKSLVILILVFAGTLVTAPVWAVEAGGKIGLGYSGTWFENGTFQDEFTDYLDLELYLPPLGRTEVSYAFRVTSPLEGLTASQETGYFTKKLYVKQRFDRFQLTVGRQPVSWSFGSLLNPVDYTIGAEAFQQESAGKFTEAVEVYIPLNWNSGLALVASFPAGFTLETAKLKWGVRGRFGIKGYDLTVNYVHEAEAAGAGSDGSIGFIPLPRRRAGFTFKGDLGDLGVYGAFGHYFGEGTAENNSYLAGIDYSYKINYDHKLTMQLEYLGLERNNLASLLGEYMIFPGEQEKINLVTGHLAYPLDDFSSIALTAMASLDGSKYLLAPSYQSILPGDLDLELKMVFFLSESMPNFTSFAVNLNYPF